MSSVQSLSNEKLAQELERVNGERWLQELLLEVAHRLRQSDVQGLLFATEAVDAITKSPMVSKETAELVETLIMAPVLKRQSSSKLSTIAGRILNGADYTHGEVISLAACVMSQDETRGQSQ